MIQDPFSAFEANGLSDRITDLITQLNLPRRPSNAHIHALLAYATQDGVKEKFDARFGDGAAAQVLEAAGRADASVALKTAVADLGARIDALAERMQKFEPPDVKPLSDQITALPGEIAQSLRSLPDDIAQSIRPLADSQDALIASLKPLSEDMRALPAKLAESMAEDESDEEEDDGPDETAVALESMAKAITQMAQQIAELKRIISAPRHIITDINGNPTGVRIGD